MKQCDWTTKQYTIIPTTTKNTPSNEKEPNEIETKKSLGGKKQPKRYSKCSNDG